MRKITNAASERRASRVEAGRQEIADRIGRALPRDGRAGPHERAGGFER
jgi:hypothetical protein